MDTLSEYINDKEGKEVSEVEKNGINS